MTTGMAWHPVSNMVTIKNKVTKEVTWCPVSYRVSPKGVFDLWYNLLFCRKTFLNPRPPAPPPPWKPKAQNPLDYWMITMVHWFFKFKPQWLEKNFWLSSIGNWGYQGNFRLFYFFTKRFRANKKQTSKQKTKRQHFYVHKKYPRWRKLLAFLCA